MDSGPVQLSLFQGPNAKPEVRPVTYTGVYAMHKYWAKKPPNLVRAFIERHSRPGDIVLDPFCGSGVVAVEAVLTGRRVVALDVNPMATFITRMTLAPVNLKHFDEAFRYLRAQIKPDIDALYTTRCQGCGRLVTATHVIWQEDVPRTLWLQCPTCGGKRVQDWSAEDQERWRTIQQQAVPYAYPQDKLIENSRVNAVGGRRVCDLFTHRNLIALSLLYHGIEEVADPTIRDLLKFAFTAALPQASQMVFVVRRRGRMNGQVTEKREEVGSWVVGYWIPRERFEIHPWNCFENRYRRVIRGKTELLAQMPKDYTEAHDFTELVRGGSALIATQSATHLSNLPTASTDYIFTDPPHGDRIPYLELSLLWMAWLGLKADFEQEIVISDAKARGKDLAAYRRGLQAAFHEMNRVLKPTGHLSVAFNNRERVAWQCLLQAVQSAGLELVDTETMTYSANSVIQDSRPGGLRGDFVLTFRKTGREP